MQLTKEQAIQEHRKMWNWIADQYDRGSNEHIGRLKELYFKNIYDGIINIPTGCFPCEYTRQNKDMISSYAYKCNECPLQWPVPENSSVVEEYCFDKYVYMDGMGVYGTLITNDIELSCSDKADITRKIANLPERK